MRVSITGSGGYVGRHVTRTLSRAGHEIVPLSRDRGFRLGEPIAPRALAGLDALIHAAYDFSARDWREIEQINVDGSLALFRAAADAGVGRLMFVSSMAAYRGCRSHYGTGKLAVEAEVLRLSGDVVRPGVIYGGEPGGMFRSLTALVARLPLIPLPGRGDQVIYLTHIDDLGKLFETLLSTQPSEGGRLLISANPQGWTLREILQRIAVEHHLRRRFLPIPASLMFTSLRAAETITGSHLPVRSDSLLSLLYPDPAPDFRMPWELRALSFRSFGHPAAATFSRSAIMSITGGGSAGSGRTRGGT
jgi:nucleoside-diphosphate-sugar epimerase